MWSGAKMSWIPLSELRPPVERNLHGVRVNVLVSPYDIPEAVRAFRDPQNDRFVIEFRYISTEDTKERDDNEHVKVRVGRNSGRLYAIEIDTKALQGNNIELRLEVKEALRNALTHLIQHPFTASRESNYRMAKDAVEQHQEQILQPI
jgi:hypothetical protein